MANHHEIANFIWSIADLLRGPYRPPQYERVMLPMTVLRRFDCVLAPTKDFDYLLANPPFGVDWKRQQKRIQREHEKLGFGGRFGAGVPRVNDGALLFLQHMISKFEPVAAERTMGSLRERRAALIAAAMTEQTAVGEDGG